MKSPDQARALVEDVVARARRAGADAADVGFSAHAALDVSVRLGAPVDVGRSDTEDLGLRVFCGRRNASVSTSALAGAAPADLFDRTIRTAPKAPPDKSSEERR